MKSDTIQCTAMFNIETNSEKKKISNINMAMKI